MERLWDKYNCNEFLANLNIDKTKDETVVTRMNGVRHGVSYKVESGRLVSYCMFKSGLPIGLSILGQSVEVYGQYGNIIAKETNYGNSYAITEDGVTIKYSRGNIVLEESNDYKRRYVDGELVSETNRNGRLFRNGDVKQSGQYVDGLLDGVVTCEGTYMDIKEYRYSRDTYKIAKKLPCSRSDTIKTIMTYSLGMLHGETQIFINGEFYETRNYINNVKEGKLLKPPKIRPEISKTYRLEDGLMYKMVSRWEEDDDGLREYSKVGDKRHGPCTILGRTDNYHFGVLHGKCSSGNYRYGKIHGERKKKLFGLDMKINLQDGLLHGTYEVRSGDILLYSLNYEHGKLTGECEIWYPNGNPCERSYLVNGKKIGSYTLYDEEGEITECVRAKSAMSV